mmetsp:Transcript_31934/g.55023  ORF Transcript_31934/g.55023 Transcript_31934/m.55023 type:complete len:1090 (+) Transcript_31934:145-3414(+)
MNTKSMRKAILFLAATVFSAHIAIIQDSLATGPWTAAKVSKLQDFLSVHLRAPIRASFFDSDETYDAVLDYTTTQISLHRQKSLYSKQALYASRDCRADFDLHRCITESALLLYDYTLRIAANFGIVEAIIIADSQVLIQISDLVRQSIFTYFAVEVNVKADYISNLLSRLIRTTGIRPIVIWGSAKLADLVLEALAKYEIDQGYALLVLGNNCQFSTVIYPTGVLCMALTGTEEALSEEEVGFWYVLYLLSSKEPSSFTIINLIQGYKYPIGFITEDTLVLVNYIVFPHGVLTPPDDEPVQLFVNLNNWVDDSEVNEQRAAMVAHAEVKLSNRKFSVTVLKLNSCGIIDPVNVYLDCYIAARTNKVSVLLSDAATEVLLGSLLFMKNAGLHIQMINPDHPLDMLSSVENFPSFTRLIQSISYYMLVSLYGLKYFKFFKFNFFISSAFGEYLAELIRSFIHEVGLTIVTPVENQMLNYLSPDPDYFKNAARVVKESGIRPMLAILYLDDFIHLFKALEEVGLGNEDVVIVGSSTTVADLLALTENKELVLDYASSYLNGASVGYFGEKGSRLKDEFAGQYGKARSNDCYNYDAMMQAITSLDFALKRGLNFASYKEMTMAVRSVRFVGCTGTVKQSLESNDRDNPLMTVSHYQSKAEVLTDVEVISIALYGSQIFFPLEDIVWADGSTDTPHVELYTYKDCPFPEELKHDSKDRTLSILGINLSLTGFAMLVAGGTYFTKHRRHFMMVQKPVLLGTQDLIFIVTSYLEVLALIMLSPMMHFVSFLLGGADKKAFWNNIDFSHGGFFNLLNSIYAGTLLWIFLFAVTIARKFRPTAVDFQLLCVSFNKVSFFFQAFIFQSTFDCNQAESDTHDSFEDAFMDVDCYTTCWKNKHLMYTMFSSLLMCFYSLTSISFAHTAIETLEGLQIEVSPAYSLSRQPFIMLIISIYKAKPMLSETSYSAAYILTLLTYLAVCSGFGVLSVPSLNLWHNLLMSLIIEISLCSILHRFAYPNLILWVSIGVVILLAIIGFGVFKTKRFPQVLRSTPKIDTATLFTFAFRPSKIALTRASILITACKSEMGMSAVQNVKQI